MRGLTSAATGVRFMERQIVGASVMNRPGLTMGRKVHSTFGVGADVSPRSSISHGRARLRRALIPLGGPNNPTAAAARWQAEIQTSRGSPLQLHGRSSTPRRSGLDGVSPYHSGMSRKSPLFATPKDPL